MSQQERFEAFYADQHDIDPEDVARYRLEDTYRLPGIASHYRTFKAAEAQAEGLRAFGNEMISAAFEGGSFDGSDIQDIAVKHGLLKLEERAGACGDHCSCASVQEFPAECYRKTGILKAVAP